MGITIVQKSNLAQKKVNPKIALVLAGGAVSGGAFKIGGLKALNDFLVNRKLTEFDMYLGLSAGAFLAVPLAGGINPEEMLASLDGKSKKFSQLSPFELYDPNYKEFFLRPLKYLWGHLGYFPGVWFDLIRSLPRLKNDLVPHVLSFVREPNYSNYEQLTKPFLKVAFSTRTIPAFGELIPSGIFDNKKLESYLRFNMRRNKMPNNFRVLKKMTGKSLYIGAMDLDTSERVIFGPDEKNDISISEAVQASSAIPGFYKPARIKGVDYIDGGVRKTANIDLAFEKGADLAICYNPFRPYANKIFLEYMREENKYITRNKRLSDWGLGTVLNQAFRTLFHSRLQTGMENLRNDPNFKKDIILIEPKEDDSDFFTMNPMFFWNRAKAAKLGFDSTCQSIQKHYAQIAPILNSYGIQLTNDVVNQDLSQIRKSSYDDQTIMDVLEKDHKSTKPLKVIRGGRN
jgi:predicted acylesterase/phospholipase RssA